MTKKRKRRNVTYKDWITEEGIIKIEGWARDGLVNEQIAQNIGIAEGTLYRWIKEHSKIDEALKKGKEVIDRQVENALLKRALGYEYSEITSENTIDTETGKVGLGVTKVVTKEVAGDTTAQIFWLKNRKPEQWRDKRETEVTGKDGGPIEIEDARQKLIEKLTKGEK